MESRTQATFQLARDLVDDVELSRLAPESILLKALRLARLAEDTSAQEWLRFELNGYRDSPEARHWMRKFGRFSDEKAGMGYWMPLAGIAGTIASMQAQIPTLQIPNINFAPSSANPHEYVGGFAGATADKMMVPVKTILGRLQEITTAVSTLASIQSRVLASVHHFVVSKYHALAFEGLAENLFEVHRAAVDELLAVAAPDVLEKLPAVYDRLSASDPEAVSQAMNSVRRMIKSLADRVYPPSSKPVTFNAQKYEVGTDKVLNRLKLFLLEKCPSESRRDRLVHAIRDIHERASAGSHADITPSEARALFLSAYLTLGEILDCGGIGVPDAAV